MRPWCFQLRAASCRSAVHLALRCAMLCLLLSRASLAWCAETSTVEAVLEFRVNAQTDSETLVAQRATDGTILLTEEDFRKLRLSVPKTAARIIDGRAYFPLNAIHDLTLSVDEQQQRVSVNAPAAAFEATDVRLASRAEPTITSAAPGAFLNYQVNGDRSAYETSAGLYSELGLFGPPGVLTNTAISNFAHGTGSGVRLETTFTHDFPSTLQTVRVGDAISNPGSWGHALRFGGVQFGTNFAVRPDLITAPLLTAGGNAVVPSTVDVFINNQPVTSQQVPPGPFVIDRLPALTGAGDVRLVVRDALGREQLITVPFYSGTTLLQSGLSDYSVELGAVRRNFAQDSFDYGTPIAAGTYRRGLSDAVTVETHAETLLSHEHAIGANIATRVGHLGVFTATIASGGDQNNSGWLSGIGFERSAQHMSFVLRTQIASEGFREPGDSSIPLRAKQQTFLQTGWNAGRAGTLSIAYGLETYRDQPRHRVVSLTHSIPVGAVGFLSLSASHTQADNNATNVFLIFTMPLGPRDSASVSARYDDDEFGKDREVLATVQRSTPIGSGTGYRVSASTAGNYQGAWTGQYNPIAVDVEAARYLGSSAQRITLTGGATYVGGDLRATRSVTDSFALVEVPGVPDVTVFLDHQPIAHTDENGRALLRNLRAYDRNNVSVDPAELPLDTRIDARSITIAPAYRSGSIVLFPVQRERSATFKLVFPDGKPVPAGANVLLKGKNYPVALDGLAFVGDFDHGMQASASWNGGSCTFRLEAPPANDPLPDLGTVVCRSAAR